MENASYGAAMRTTSPVKPLTVEDREMRAATLCDRVEDAPARLSSPSGWGDRRMVSEASLIPCRGCQHA